MDKAEIALAGVLGIVGIAMVMGSEIRVAERSRKDALSAALFGFGCFACFLGWCGPYIHLVVSALLFGSPTSAPAAVGLSVLVIALIVVCLRLSDKEQGFIQAESNDKTRLPLP